jgi:predicted amidohydrolase
MEVFLGARPPQTAGSDVIAWTAGSGGPTGDQLWIYDAANRLLVNQVSMLALYRGTNNFFALGTSATDGARLTIRSNPDGTYSLVLDDGWLVALGIGNCPGASFEAIAAPSSSYATTFRLY